MEKGDASTAVGKYALAAESVTAIRKVPGTT
jgi:hypothetical protein